MSHNSAQFCDGFAACLIVMQPAGYMAPTIWDVQDVHCCTLVMHYAGFMHLRKLCL